MAEVAAATPVIKVVALCGLSAKLPPTAASSAPVTPAPLLPPLCRRSAEIAPSIDGVQIEYVDVSTLPFLNTDLEANGVYPSPVEAFRRKILTAHAVLFASPDYNYSITGPLKNAIDWGSRPPNVWAGKSAAVVSASGGSRGARSQYHLRQIGVFVDLHFINKPEFFLNVHLRPSKFDGHGNLIDDPTREQLRQVLIALYDLTLQLQSK